MFITDPKPGQTHVVPADLTVPPRASIDVDFEFESWTSQPSDATRIELRGTIILWGQDRHAFSQEVAITDDQ
jgi:hypothetical protein